MGPSRILVAPGLRTAARTGWRSGVATALAVVVEQPSLWVLGALGYLLRGGLLVLTMAIIVVPTPVAIRLMLGGYLGSAGFAPEFYVIIGAALLFVLLVVLAALAVTAWAELSAFERFVGRAVSPPTRAARRRLLVTLFLVQVAALAALALAAVPLLATAGQAAYGELLRPNLAGGALYDRILAQLGDPLYVLLIGLVVVEMVSAVASRRLMARAYGVGGSRVRTDDRPSIAASALAAIGVGVLRPLLRPLSTLPTALLGWLVMLAALLPIGWALPLAWQAVRTQFMAGFSLEALPGLLLVSALLSLVWLVGLGLAGFASAVRAGLWTSEELR